MPGTTLVESFQPQSAEELLDRFFKAAELRMLIKLHGEESAEVKRHRLSNPLWKENESIFWAILKETAIWKHRENP